MPGWKDQVVVVSKVGHVPELLFVRAIQVDERSVGEDYSASEVAIKPCNGR